MFVISKDKQKPSGEGSLVSSEVWRRKLLLSFQGTFSNPLLLFQFWFSLSSPVFERTNSNTQVLVTKTSVYCLPKHFFSVYMNTHTGFSGLQTRHQLPPVSSFQRGGGISDREDFIYHIVLAKPKKLCLSTYVLQHH